MFFIAMVMKKNHPRKASITKLLIRDSLQFEPFSIKYT